jgi:valyl-tRNA synthetase
MKLCWIPVYSTHFGLLNPRLPGDDGGSEVLLSYKCAGNRLRYHYFLGARMNFFRNRAYGKIPFPEVLIHGLVRDSQTQDVQIFGQRNRSSELIQKYGADAVRFRFAQALRLAPISASEKKNWSLSRNFLNKIWNAAKFVQTVPRAESCRLFGTFRLDHADKWIQYKLDKPYRKSMQISENTNWACIRKAV